MDSAKASGMAEVGRRSASTSIPQSALAVGWALRFLRANGLIRHALSIRAVLKPRSYGASLFARAFQVLAGAGVDLEHVAGVYEERDVNADAGLQFGGLGAALSGVAAHPGVGLGDR